MSELGKVEEALFEMNETGFGRKAEGKGECGCHGIKQSGSKYELGGT